MLYSHEVPANFAFKQSKRLGKNTFNLHRTTKNGLEYAKPIFNSTPAFVSSKPTKKHKTDPQ